MSKNKNLLHAEKQIELYNKSTEDIELAVKLLLEKSDSQFELGEPEIQKIIDSGEPNYTAIVHIPISGELSEDLQMEKRFLVTNQFSQILPKSPLVSIKSIDITEGKLVVFVSGFPKSAIKAISDKK